MTLESAERLVERILRQLEVAYEVEPSPDGGTRIVVDADRLESLPAELSPFVAPRSAEDPSQRKP
jgi:hypothetical protein